MIKPQLLGSKFDVAEDKFSLSPRRDVDGATSV
jgi:hypothetical protein